MEEKTFEQIQQKQLNMGKIILLIALIFESANLIPGILLTDLWFCPWALNTTIFAYLNRQFPKITFVCSIAAFYGYPVGRYGLAVIYGIDAWRIIIMIASYFTALPSINGISILFAIIYPIAFIYYLTMCILLLSSKGVGEYMYAKRYKYNG